jgi:cytochrome P450
VPTRNVPPGPRGDLLIGSLRLLQRDPLRFFVSLSRQYGDVVRYRFLHTQSIFVNHPAHVRRVLQENNRNYDKQVFSFDLLRRALGQGLLTNDGESWLRQRRLMQPAFHRQRLAGFGALMTEATTALLDEQWRAAAARGRALDIAAEMHRLTLRIVGQALFGLDLTREAETVGQALTVAQRRINDQFFTPFLPLWVPVRSHREFRAAIKTLDAVVYGIIRERRGRSEDRGDLMSMLLLARDADTGAGMDDRQLRDEVLTLLLAGHETTANALTWTWYLLSQHPAVWRRLQEELAAVLGGRPPAVDDLPRLPYTRMVLDEALRLYPPAWVITRRTVADDEIGGYLVPAGTVMVISPYAMHHNPRVWDNPEGFDPERFTPERTAARAPFAYFPFGGGPRLCIGNNFALLEGQLILATVAQRYRLDRVPGHPVAIEPLVTLRTKYGLRMTLHPVRD